MLKVDTEEILKILVYNSDDTEGESITYETERLLLNPVKMDVSYDVAAQYVKKISIT